MIRATSRPDRKAIFTAVGYRHGRLQLFFPLSITFIIIQLSSATLCRSIKLVSIAK